MGKSAAWSQTFVAALFSFSHTVAFDRSASMGSLERGVGTSKTRLLQRRVHCHFRQTCAEHLKMWIRGPCCYTCTHTCTGMRSSGGSANVDIRGESWNAFVKAGLNASHVQESWIQHCILKRFQRYLPLASEKLVLSSVRKDVALPPLRPGIVSKGPLPTGSRMSGLFESRSKPHVSFRTTLWELYACWTCWMSGWRDLWSKSRWSLALRPQDRDSPWLVRQHAAVPWAFSLKIVFLWKENSDRLPVLAALPGVLLGFFPSSRSAPVCCHDSLSMKLRKLQFHIIAVGGHLSIEQLHQQPAAALLSCA